jgi:hypothetical protein
MDGFRRALVLGLLAAALACQGALLKVDVEAQATGRVQGAAAAPDARGFPELERLAASTTEDLRDQGVDPGDLAFAHLRVLTLSVTSDDGDLSFLDGITLYVEAPGLDRVRLASGADFPRGLRSADLVLEDVDLGPYLEQDAVTVGATAAGRRPEDPVTLEASLVLEVGVTPRGACSAIEGDLGP